MPGLAIVAYAAFVDLTVAVVINLVAELSRRRVDVRVAVVAIVVGQHIAYRLLNRLRRHARVPVPVAVGVAVPSARLVAGATLIDLAIAVIVPAIADFSRAMMDPRI